MNKKLKVKYKKHGKITYATCPHCGYNTWAKGGRRKAYEELTNKGKCRKCKRILFGSWWWLW